MSTPDLKRCPFCLGPARVLLRRPDSWRVECDVCYAVCEPLHATAEEAAAEWNRWVRDIGAKMSADAEATDGEATRP